MAGTYNEAGKTYNEAGATYNDFNLIVAASSVAAVSALYTSSDTVA